MKHALPAAALFALAFLGCGKESPPAAAPPPAPAMPAAPSAPKEVVHELDAAKHAVPAQPVSGRLAGKPFTPDRVEVDGNVFTFRQGPALSPDTQLIFVAPGALVPGKEYRTTVRADQKAGNDTPTISLSTKAADGQLKIDNVAEGYALTLELAGPEKGSVAGKIHLSLPGATKDVIAGTFTAIYDRSTIVPPSADDKPYLTGGIDHKGTENTTLIVGYVRMPAAGQEPMYDTVQVTIPKAGEAVGAVRSSANKPRSATIRPNDDGTATEYDLTKLPPGKYLVAARLEGGIPAWFVKDVTADAALTVALSLKTEVAGHADLDVPGLPEGVSAQVQVLPAEVTADDPTGQYEAHAGLILGTWANLEKGKVTIRQLPAGEYVASARAGDVRYSAKFTAKPGDAVKVELKAP